MTTARYEIAGSDYRCGNCAQELACDGPYFSAIFFDGGEFHRKNYCVDCWDGPSVAPKKMDEPPPGDGSPDTARTGASQRPFAFWRTRRPPLPSEAPKKMRFDCDLVLQLFKGLQDAAPDQKGGGGEAQADTQADTQADGEHPTPSTAESGEREELGFVLALLLVRKKVLTLQSTAEREGSEWLKISEKRASKSSFWIRNPELDPSQLERLKVRIGELLQMQV